MNPPTGTPKYRIGSVQYLNAVPLTRGIESEVVFATPAQLAEMLRRDELDAALVSITEVLLNDRYDILDGIAIASLGEVYSVLLAHRRPLESITEVFCHTASLSGLNLLKVLLAERGLKPEFKPLPDPARRRSTTRFSSSVIRRLIFNVRGTSTKFSISAQHGMN